MLPEDAHHGEKLRDVTLSQKGRFIYGRMGLAHLLA